MTYRFLAVDDYFELLMFFFLAIFVDVVGLERLPLDAAVVILLSSLAPPRRFDVATTIDEEHALFKLNVSAAAVSEPPNPTSSSLVAAIVF